MSTIKVDQLLAADGTTTTPPTIPALDTRFCTAWVNFNGSGVVAIRDSYNVASITDNGVGLYTANLAVALANSNFASVAIGQRDATRGNTAFAARATSSSTIEFSSYTISSLSHSDCENAQIVAFGGV